MRAAGPNNLFLNREASLKLMKTFKNYWLYSIRKYQAMRNRVFQMKNTLEEKLKEFYA